MKKRTRFSIKTPADEITQLKQDVFTAVEMLNQQLAIITDRLIALTTVLGMTDKVEEEVSKKLAQIKVERVKEVQEGLKLALEAGEIIPTETISQDSLIVGVEIDDKGEEVAPYHVQQVWRGFNEDVQVRLLGCRVGDTIDAGSSKFNVRGIYEPASRIQTLN
jgi:hypothetical protein